jgi:integrase
MAKRNAGVKIIWRKRPEWGGAARAYLDLRHLGKGRIALIPEGQSYATSDPETAERLAKAISGEMETQRLRAERLGLRRETILLEAADEHLQLSQAAGLSVSWLLYQARALDRACTFFDVEQAKHADTAAERRRCAGPRHLERIGPPDVRAWVRWLGTQPSGRRGLTLGPGSVRQHLAALSSLFTRAISDGLLPMGANPVVAMLDKPAAAPSPTHHLEPADLALLLEAARTLPVERSAGRRPLLACAYELLAAFLLLGVREGEARALDVGDIDFRRGEVHVRGTKTAGSDRIVPMPPQLREILLPYVGRLGRLHGPLFATADGERFGDWRATLDAVAERAGLRAGAVRSRRFRVSYGTHACTVDGWDANTVRLALGHGSLVMMERVYARAQRRSERMGAELAFRIERYVADPDTAARLDAMLNPRPVVRPIATPAAEVARFLEKTAGLGTKRAEHATGVDRATIQRLRKARGAVAVQGRTLDAIRSYLAGQEAA